MTGERERVSDWVKTWCRFQKIWIFQSFIHFWVCGRYMIVNDGKWLKFNNLWFFENWSMIKCWVWMYVNSDMNDRICLWLEKWVWGSYHGWNGYKNVTNTGHFSSYNVKTGRYISKHFKKDCHCCRLWQEIKEHLDFQKLSDLWYFHFFHLDKINYLIFWFCENKTWYFVWD